MADAFFFVLKLNFGRGSTAARVSASLSWSALMAWGENGQYSPQG
jgi:hypothetical protein